MIPLRTSTATNYAATEAGQYVASLSILERWIVSLEVIFLLKAVYVSMNL